jgi:hypothetical protein
MVLLGELDKYVALSPIRFSNIKCTQAGIDFTISCSDKETVKTTLIIDEKITIHVKQCGPTGQISFKAGYPEKSTHN